MTDRFSRREASRWKWTNTAHDRLVEFGFDAADVYAAILNPVSVEPGQGRGTQVRRRGNVAAVVDPASFTVVTVMDAYGTRPSMRRVHRVAETVLRPSVPRIVRVEPEPTPPPLADEDEAWVVDPSEVKNMAARIRLLGKAAVEAGEVPTVSKMWLLHVCLPRLREYPGRWASLLSAPYPSVAEAMAEQVTAQYRAAGHDIEIRVSGPRIYGRST